MSGTESEHTTIEAALLAALAEIPTIKKDGWNPHLQSKFVNIDSILKVVHATLAKHGLRVFQPSVVVDGNAAVETVVRSKSGESLSLGTIAVPWRSAKGLTDAQAFGSSLTYARRYGLVTALGLATGDDDDGAGSGGEDDAIADPMTVKVAIFKRIKELGFSGDDEIAGVYRDTRRRLSIGEDDNDSESLVEIRDALADRTADDIMDFLNGHTQNGASK